MRRELFRDADKLDDLLPDLLRGQLEVVLGVARHGLETKKCYINFMLLNSRALKNKLYFKQMSEMTQMRS